MRSTFSRRVYVSPTETGSISSRVRQQCGRRRKRRRPRRDRPRGGPRRRQRVSRDRRQCVAHDATVSTCRARLTILRAGSRAVRPRVHWHRHRIEHKQVKIRRLVLRQLCLRSVAAAASTPLAATVTCAPGARLGRGDFDRKALQVGRRVVENHFENRDRLRMAREDTAKRISPRLGSSRSSVGGASNRNQAASPAAYVEIPVERGDRLVDAITTRVPSRIGSAGSDSPVEQRRICDCSSSRNIRGNGARRADANRAGPCANRSRRQGETLQVERTHRAVADRVENGAAFTISLRRASNPARRK